MYTHNTVNRDFHVEQFTTKNGKLRLTIRDSKGRLAELTRPQNLDAKSNTFEVVNFITKHGITRWVLRDANTGKLAEFTMPQSMLAYG